MNGALIQRDNQFIEPPSLRRNNNCTLTATNDLYLFANNVLFDTSCATCFSVEEYQSTEKSLFFFFFLDFIVEFN